MSIAPMRKILLSALTLTALAAAGAASAATPATSTTPSASATAAPSPGSRHAAWRQKFFDQIDTNHDGTISRAEYQAWVDGRFAKLDANGDGAVNADEIATSPAAVERVQKRAEGFVKRYDTSGSGEVTKADFEAKEMQRFDRLSNGADSVTEDEFDAAAAHRFNHRHGAPAASGG
jgi:opacity protein-like surface antigen